MSKIKLSKEEQFMEHLRLGEMEEMRAMYKAGSIDLNKSYSYKFLIERGGSNFLECEEYPLCYCLSWAVAVRGSNLEIVRFLLENGAQMNLASKENCKSPMLIAVEKYIEHTAYQSLAEAAIYENIIKIFIENNIVSLLSAAEKEYLLESSTQAVPIYDLLNAHFHGIENHDASSSYTASAPSGTSAMAHDLCDFWTRKVRSNSVGSSFNSFSGWSGRKLVVPLREEDVMKGIAVQSGTRI